MTEHQREDLRYSSVIALVFTLVAGVLLFFGANNNTSWLSIVGLVIYALGIVVTLFLSPSNGIFVLILAVGVPCIAHFFGDKTPSNFVTNWVFENGTTGLAYFAKLGVISTVVLAFVLLIKFLSSYQRD